MVEAYRIASKAAQTRAAQGKQQHDKKVCSSVLEPGDRVLVKNLTPCGGALKAQIILGTAGLQGHL